MKYKSRRQFIKEFGLGALGITTASSITQLKAFNAAYLNNTANTFNNDYKAIVCFFLNGGNDSFNMVVPRGNPEYDEYAVTRSDLAISQNELLPITPVTSDGKQYGLNPAMTHLHQLFNNGKVSFINNVGPLIEPTTKITYQNNSSPIPLGLFSHSDQLKNCQTGLPHVRTHFGWGGKMADMLNDMNMNQNVSMNISLSGTNIFQYGQTLVEFAIDPYDGSPGIDGYDPLASGFNGQRTEGIDLLLGVDHPDMYKKTYTDILKRSLDGSIEFRAAMDQIGTLNTFFSDNRISQSFKRITEVIMARDILGFKRQIFFVQMGGWDMHGELIDSHERNLTVVDNAMNEFVNGLEEIGMFDAVTTFTISDFGRTLTSNGNGSDHAWGGNAFVMGGDIKGGDMYGAYPSLALGGNYEIHNGVLIPTTSNDQYFAELALWFGVSPGDLSTLFPNIGNFYDTGSGMAPLGFMNL
ncbi:MAG: DUF1501 domain-containing protein [Bacteroidetes bacterium]|nr:MAG: DUF1501 domain-containing protein [Bacteroidota bacterium]